MIVFLIAWSTSLPGELEFPGGKWNLAFQFQPPQHVTVAGAGMKFSINSFTKNNWQLGFVRPDGFDVWRGKKKQSARVKKQPVDIHVKAGDGRAVQSAIDKAAEAGGGTVHLAAGRYPVSASIHLRNNVRLVGEPGKTVLAMTPAKTRVRLAKDGKRFVRQIKLADSSNYKVGDGVTISDTKNATGFMVTTATLAKDLGSGAFALDTYLRFDYDVSRDATIRSAFPIVTGWKVNDVAVENLIVEGNRKQGHTEHIGGCRGGASTSTNATTCWCAVAPCGITTATGSAFSGTPRTSPSKVVRSRIIRGWAFIPAATRTTAWSGGTPSRGTETVDCSYA